MTQPTDPVRYAPEGWPTVIPRIVVEDGRSLVAFVKRVFDATGDYREAQPAELRIGDSMIMISEAGPRAAMSAFLYVYVADVDATYERAVASGAHSIEAPTEMPYGDRRAMVEDEWGNTWQIATHLRSFSSSRP